LILENEVNYGLNISSNRKMKRDMSTTC